MPQCPEAKAFLARIAALPPGPGVSDVISQTLQLSLDDEATLRSLWVTDRSHPRLHDPHVGLVDVFDAPLFIRHTRARVVTSNEDLSAHYILPLPADRCRNDGDPSMVASLDEFKHNWALFTEGSLSQAMDWSHVVAAGGAILACLGPVPETAKISDRELRSYYQHVFPTSDVDLFLYGLSPLEAEKKIQEIYAAVCRSLPVNVTCVRTQRTITIYSQPPYRPVQIVLQLFSSPAEILAGFDVDAACCAFDGDHVWANPRAIVAMMRQCNTVDVIHHSPSYEVRLTKYALRNFEVYFPSLRRHDIDPYVYQRSFLQHIPGLARLLALEWRVETLAYGQAGQFTNPRTITWHEVVGTAAGIVKNNYDVPFLHIPYNADWGVDKIKALVQWTDERLNMLGGLHRHLAFCGTMEECLQGSCKCCPQPDNDVEKALQWVEDHFCVRGHVRFNYGHPIQYSITEEEWTEDAYAPLVVE